MTIEEHNATMTGRSAKKTIKRILVVDDDELLITALKHQLSASGFEVTAAADGGEAIEKMKKQTPDLILLDIMMPYVSGLEFLNLIDTHYVVQGRVPVILISSLKKEELIAEGYDLGKTLFLPKPFAIKDLQTMIDVIMKGQKY